MVSTHPLISKSSSPFTKLWRSFRTQQFQLVLPSPSCSIPFSVLWQGPSIFLSFRFLRFLPCGPPEWQSPLVGKFGFFFSFFVKDYLVWSSDRIRWSLRIAKSQRFLCVSFSKTDSGFCKYHLAVWSNFSFLHNSKWITFLAQSCQVLYSFCPSLLHSLNMWLMASFLSLYNLHFLFYCVKSILVLTSLVFMTLFCVTIRRNSISLA